jgi:class 3 adenylate cyclase/tetratricopeptide (TPR) repeat protein
MADDNRLEDAVEQEIESQKTRISGQRRDVAVLFADIKGFTSTSDKMYARYGDDGDEEMVRVNDSYWKVIEEIIKEQGGVKDKIMGDAILAHFGAKVKHENDALRAVFAAYRIVEALKRMNPIELERFRERFELPIKIAVHYGPVRAGEVGYHEKEFTVMGDNVNLASRLEDLAGAWEIVISDEVYQKVKERFSCEDMGEHDFKGKKGVRVWRVVDRKARTVARQRPEKLPFYGRENEISRLKENKGKVLVTGEAGSGKSRLIEEAGLDNYLRAGCQSIDQSRPLGVFDSLLREYFNLSVDDISAQFKDLAGEERKQAMFNAIKSVFDNESLGIVIEDVHWIDEMSAELLNEISKPSIVMTSRPYEKGTGFDADSRLGYDDSIEVKPLTKTQLTKLAKDAINDAVRTGKLAKDTKVNYFAKEIVAKAKGNPFMVIQLVSGEGKGIDDIVMSRITKLGEDVTSAMQYISVIGSVFEQDVFEAIASLDVSPESMLERLELYGLIRKGKGNTFELEHHLYGEVLYKSLEDRTRKKLHWEIARFLEKNDLNHVTGDRNVAGVSNLDLTLAHHFAKADMLQRAAREKAATYLERAGEYLSRNYANTQAVESFKKASAILENDDSMPAWRKQIEMLLRCTPLYEILGEKEAFIELAEKIEELIEEPKDSLLTYDWRAKHSRGAGMLRLGRFDDALEQYNLAEELAKKTKDRNYALVVVNLVKGLTHDLKSRILKGIGKQKCLENALAAYEKAERLANEALDIKNKDKDMIKKIKANLAYIHNNKSNMYCELAESEQDEQKKKEYFEQMIDCEEKALKINEEFRDKRLLAVSYCIRCDSLIRAGEIEKAIEAGEKSLKLADESGNIETKSGACVNLGRAYYEAGRHEEGARLLNDAEENAANLGQQDILNEVKELREKYQK